MESTLGIYIHIPFCAGKCAYCDFYSLAGQGTGMMDKYLEALQRHIRESARAMAPYYIDTVYFGGGTPSYFGAKRIREILNTLKAEAKVLKSAEITVEMNPDSVNAEGLRILKNEGVNRISLGMQSANDRILKAVGRIHTHQQTENAVKLIRAEGFDNLSLDLIYGLPAQGKTDWADTLAKAIALRPEHLSCYGLKIEDGTPLADYKESEFLPSDDDQADMYLYTVDQLEKYGYPQYEISNFSLPEKWSRHNIKYWNMDDYMGFGPGAHSCIGGLRYSYISDLNGYINGVNAGGNIIDEYEPIDKAERAAEYIMLRMRTVGGISKKEYVSIYRSGFEKIEQLLKEYEKKGWAERIGERWRFTSSGYLLSNILIGYLLEAQSQEKIRANPWMMETGEDEKRSSEAELLSFLQQERQTDIDG